MNNLSLHRIKPLSNQIFRAARATLFSPQTPKHFKLALAVVVILVLWAGTASAAYQDIFVSWKYNTSTANLDGFRIYQNGNLVCENWNPAARSMNCSADLGNTASRFTMTAFNDAGAESPHSTIFELNPLSTDGGNLFPVAAFSMKNGDGTSQEEAGLVPRDDFLTITFDASASQDPDGAIVEYLWDFGDNHLDAGVVVTHTYAVSGAYTVSLSIMDNQGTTARVAKNISLSNDAPVTTPSTTSLDAAGGGGGGCSLAVGHRKPTQAADWLLVGTCLTWLAIRNWRRPQEARIS
jgi:hypothetical protein